MIPLFVINMRRSPDRWAHMEDEASRTGVSELIKRHEGVDGGTAEIDPFLPYVNQKKALKIKGRELSEGQIGCFASHFSLWDRIRTTEMGAIVFEDDIGLAQPLSSFVNSTQKFANGCACIRLFTSETEKATSVRLFNSENFSIRRYNKGHMGAQAYYLSPKAAGQLVAYAYQWYLPVDLYMDAFWIHGVECLGTDPAFAIRHNAPTVRTGSTRRKLNIKGKIKKEIAAIGTQTRRGVHNAKFDFKRKVKGIDDIF